MFLPDDVYTASFGGDVKLLVPGYWLVLAISSYLVSHPNSGGVLSKWCGFSNSQDTLQNGVVSVTHRILWKSRACRPSVTYKKII